MIRITQQRDAIRQVFLDAARPLSTQEVLALARREVSGIGIATVYRNLKSLQEERWIVAVDLPGQPPRWEIAPESHHHHFLCNTCDKLYEILACPEDLQHLLPEGYTLEEHDILLRGQCDTCSRKVSANPNQKRVGRSHKTL
jgi:Fur family ferric uptake transcriptional regulator